MTRRLFMIIGFLLSMTLHAQPKDQETAHRISLLASGHQIKDHYNYGLVHSGLILSAAYWMESKNESRILSLRSQLGFGANFRKGIGMVWAFKPVDLNYGFEIIKGSKWNLYFGPYTSAIYSWQIYPELQSGHLFWMSSYEIGPRLNISVPFGKRTLDLSYSNAVLSMGSRPSQQTEEYFYSMQLKDFPLKAHENMQLSLPNDYNHFELTMRLSNPSSRISFAYTLEWVSYQKTPDFQQMTHSLELIWRLKSKK